MVNIRALPLLLAACSDYAFDGKDENPVGFDTGDTPPVDTAVPDSTPVDSDPAPGACDLDAPAEGTVPIVEACTDARGGEVDDPWNVRIEWAYDTGGSGVLVMPAVGNLTDDDGDGDVDTDDDPDVVFSEWDGYLTALRGDGTTLFRLSGFAGTGGVSIADVTGDGRAEIVAVQANGRVVALDGSGTVLWTSGSLSWIAGNPQPTVADVDNDGDAEVIYDYALLDGATGAFVAAFDDDYQTMWRTPVVADLDLDGTREILLGTNVYRPDGTVVWKNSGVGPGNFSAVAQLDADPEAEVLIVSMAHLLVYEHDGTLIHDVPIDPWYPGPPAVADFDGDGAVEIAIPGSAALYVYETDGTLLWASPSSDVSGLAGCSGFDLDGDGAYEVLYADEVDFRIHDGRTGAVVYTDGTHDSGTLWEYPVVADVDHDGDAEILVASSLYGGTSVGVTVYGHDGAGWPASGPTWGTHDFAVTNLEADGTVPTGETPSWLADNLFRARPSWDGAGLADLVLDAGDLCVSGCGDGDEVEIAWQVANQGAVSSAPARLELYRVDWTAQTLLDSVAVPRIAAGAAPAGGVFSVAAETLTGSTGYALRIAGITHTECDDTNDAQVVNVEVCP